MNLLMHKLAYKHWVAIIYILVLFLDRLDLTIVNIALPTLANYFHVPIAETSWVNTSFLLALAVAIPISSWLGDKFGLKRVFILATALFGLTSFLSAFAPNLFIMTLLRYMQGIGGGIIIPVGMTMVYRNFEPKEYASITSYMFMPALLAPAIAPALGGAIIKWLSWHWIFIFAAPVCLLAICFAVIKLKEHKVSEPIPLDWSGFILISLSLSLLFYAISLASKIGLAPSTYLGGICAIILFVIFIMHEQKTPYPLIDLRFFKNRLFVQANFIQLAFQICHFGSFFLIGIYLQLYAQLSALSAGIVIGMQALGALLTSRYSVYLFNHFGARLPIIIGLMGVALLSVAILGVKSPAQFILGMMILFLRGIFSGLCGTPIQTLSVIDFNKQDVGKASVIFNASRQIAISLGIALFSVLISYPLKSTTQIILSVFYLPFSLIPITAVLGIIFALTIDMRKMGYE